MPFRNFGPIEYFYFESLWSAGLIHGIFSRRGGVSEGRLDSLNTGSLVGDDPRRVAENLARAAAALGRDPETLVGVRQVHGDAVHRVDSVPEGNSLERQLAPFSGGGFILPEADAVITANPVPTLFMRYADCVPILLFDPVQGAAGLVHAGWRGTVLKTAARALDAFAASFGTRPQDVLAGIGPAICADHYEVGHEVAQAAGGAFGARSGEVLRPRGDRFTLDLWEANRLALEESGVVQIEIAGECTAERTDLWFSHRGEQGLTGRFAALVGIAHGR